MQKFNAYDDIVVSKPRRIKSGLYPGKIIDAKVEKVNTKKGEMEVLRVLFDISEGEYKDYYKKLYDFKEKGKEKKDKRWECDLVFWLESKNSTEEANKMSAERFKRFINDVEKSNEGFKFDWDEKKLVGKEVGLAFSLEEWLNRENNIFTSVKLRRTVDLDIAKEYNYETKKDEIPAVKCIDGTYISYTNYIQNYSKDYSRNNDNSQGTLEEDSSFITIEDTDDIPF